MTDGRLAKHAHAVFAAGLDLKRRVGESGGRLDFEREHGKLRNLLHAEGEVGALPDYAGDRAGRFSPRGTLSDPGGQFLGAQYALAAWLDEIFITDSPWSARWTESMLEVALYGGSGNRAWKFWEQAKRAEPKPDALEVYLWCYLLGFRGDLEGLKPLTPEQWADTARRVVLRGYGREFQVPPGRELPTEVRVLTGRERLALLGKVAAGLVLLGVPVAVFTAVAVAPRKK